MNPPKDYQEPQEVRDYAAERGIKWGSITAGIIQGLILAAIIGMNSTLTEIRNIIAGVNTKTEVNSTRVDSVEKRLDNVEQTLYQKE